MKKLLCLLLILIFVPFAITACEKKDDAFYESKDEQTSSTSSPAEMSMDEYADLVSDYVEDIENASMLLSNMASYEYNYWSALDSVNGNFDSDKAVLNARDWLSEKADVEENKIETDYKMIVGTYSDIIVVDVAEKQAELLKENITKLYDEYCSLYILATSPGGNLSSFTTSYNSYVDNITNYLKIINASIEAK